MANLKKGGGWWPSKIGISQSGTRLVASYRKQAHACMVEKADEGGGILFVLEDGRHHRPP